MSGNYQFAIRKSPPTAPIQLVTSHQPPLPLYRPPLHLPPLFPHRLELALLTLVATSMGQIGRSPVRAHGKVILHQASALHSARVSRTRELSTAER